MSKMHNPPHPGEVLRDGVFADTGITVTRAAKTLGVTRAALSRVLNGKAAMSADMALRLAQWLGTGPEVLVNMQATYDLWQARKQPLPKIKRLR
jgi:addiction module HigA family antidote